MSLREVDGGSEYYGKFENALPTEAQFFPIGVWLEEITAPDQVEIDRAAGINLYVDLTNPSRIDLIAGTGMHALAGRGLGKPGVVGSVLADEADMWGGPGSDEWTGKYPGQGSICEPSSGKCGYSVMTTMADSVRTKTMSYANYGKGVTFWESDAEAKRFVNDFQDVVSADNYWFTDPNICAASEGGVLLNEGKFLGDSECRLAANYGRTVERVRGLMDPVGARPVWAFVELGHPASEDDAPTITGPEIRAAVWSSIIHGARGVVYFNHSFGGDCISQHVLRDSCGAGIRGDVSTLNRRITRLAPVLNSPFLDGFAESNSVDVAAKLYDDHVYVIAGARSAEDHEATIDLSCSPLGSADVLDESRTVPIIQGRLSDRFEDGNAVHIYRFKVSSSCSPGR